MRCCYKCKDRHISCHSTCENYIRAVIRREARKAIIRANREAENDINGFFINRLEVQGNARYYNKFQSYGRHER